MFSLHHLGYRVAGWIGVGVLTLALVVTLVRAQWQGVLVLAGFLVGSVGFLLWKNRLPALFDFLFVLAALLNAAGWVFDFYDLPGFDPFSHFYTTFALTLAAGYAVYFSVQIHFQEHRSLYVVTIASFGLALGGLWEIFEWSVGIGQTYQTVAMDLIMDSLGAVLAGLLSAWTIASDSNDSQSE